MKTHRIYYDDAYVKEFDARVMYCELRPPDVNSGITSQVWGLVLDRTAFYPTSGGQPNDLGKIGDANVLDVRDDGDEIIHIVDRRPSSRMFLAASTGHAASITCSNIRGSICSQPYFKNDMDGQRSPSIWA